MTKLDILIADDEALVRDGLRALLEKEKFVGRVFEARDKHDFYASIAAISFDLILLDFRMGETNGLELFKSLRDTAPASKVIMLTGFEGEELVVNMLKTGVNSILYKLDGYREVVNAINAVMDTGTYFPEKVHRIIRQQAPCTS